MRRRSDWSSLGADLCFVCVRYRSIPDRNAGRTEAARAYRLLHTGMAQAVADGLTPAHPCLVKGASQ